MSKQIKIKVRDGYDYVIAITSCEPLMEIGFDIFMSDDESEELVGEAKIILCNNLNKYNLYDVFDCFDSYVIGGFELFEAINFCNVHTDGRILIDKHNKGNIKVKKSFLIIDDIRIRDDVRNLGIGSLVLDYIEMIYGVGRTKYLMSSPLSYQSGNYEGDDYSEIKSKLNSFYEKRGYKVLKSFNPNGGEEVINIYYKN